MATKLEFLVAKLKVLVAFATVSVSISSPVLNVLLCFVLQAQVVLQGKSRAAIIRELQRTVSFFCHIYILYSQSSQYCLQIVFDTCDGLSCKKGTAHSVVIRVKQTDSKLEVACCSGVINN